MAQLRDAHTSECVFTGSPLECAAVAAVLGANEVLFDDVGEHFDPKATLKASEDDAKSHDAVAKSSSTDADAKKIAIARAKEIRDEIAAAQKQKSKIEKAMQAARDRRES